MSNKITIIGAGSVGATVAFMMAVRDIAAEIVMIDINERKAKAEAMDIGQGTCFTAPCRIYAGKYADAAGSDIVVITSGVGRKPGQSRLDLAQTNVDIAKSIAGEIAAVCPDAIYIIVSNPVDIITYVFNKITDLPERRVIGTGTLLDTARLCSRLAECLDVSKASIDAYVLGEHGDSSFVPWSVAAAGNVPIEDFRSCVRGRRTGARTLDYEAIEKYMRTSGAKIIERKGATFYAIAISVCHICECIYDDAKAIIPVSSMLHGEYGIENVCLSLPTIVSAKGMDGKVLLPLNDAEVELLRNSAQVLKQIIAQVKI